MQDKSISIDRKAGSNNYKTKVLHYIVDDFFINVIEIVTSYENFHCRT